jgi:predicted metallopeptidase
MPDPVTWSEASPSVLHIAQDLIKTVLPILAAEQVNIAFVFRSVAQKQGERYILGQCTKVPAKFQPYLEYDYIIWLSEEDYMSMDDRAREALIYHELLHCKYNFEAGSWGIRPHDIQEFSQVIERYGIWSPDVRKVKDAIDKYEMQTLPGLMHDAFDKLTGEAKVVTMTGAELEKAAHALGG